MGTSPAKPREAARSSRCPLRTQAPQDVVLAVQHLRSKAGSSRAGCRSESIGELQRAFFSPDQKCQTSVDVYPITARPVLAAQPISTFPTTTWERDIAPGLFCSNAGECRIIDEPYNYYLVSSDSILTSMFLTLLSASVFENPTVRCLFCQDG